MKLLSQMFTQLITRLFERFGFVPAGRPPRKYALTSELEAVLESLSAKELRSPDAIAADLITDALARQRTNTHTWQCWASLSKREKQVVALICLDYTNPQIGALLGLSHETINSYSHNAQIKFNLHSKTALRVLLADWDFRGWDEPAQPVTTRKR